MNVVGLVSCYREGRLVTGAIESLRNVDLDRLLVYEGPAYEGRSGPAFVSDVSPSEFPDDVQPTLGSWLSDANKRDAMLKAVHKLHLDAPVWGVWLDGDEILCNGEYLRDVLQMLAWQDEYDENPWMRWPIRLVEASGEVSTISNRIVRLDLIRSIDISTSVVTDVNGEERAWGNTAEDSQVWMDHVLGALDRGRMMCWPPFPCEPHIFHRSHLRHPLRRGARMHKQETVELGKRGL